MPNFFMNQPSDGYKISPFSVQNQENTSFLLYNKFMIHRKEGLNYFGFPSIIKISCGLLKTTKFLHLITCFYLSNFYVDYFKNLKDKTWKNLELKK